MRRCTKKRIIDVEKVLLVDGQPRLSFWRENPPKLCRVRRAFLCFDSDEDKQRHEKQRKQIVDRH